jgi:hypothetical protein
MSNNEYTPGQGADQGADTEKTSAATDFITRLTGDGLLTKRWVRETPKRKPTSIAYDQLSIFNAKMVPVTSLAELAGVLDNLNKHQAVIHGGLIGRAVGEVAKNIPRWLYPRGEDAPATIEEAPHYWTLLDVDGIPCPADLDPIAEPERAAAHVISLLPEEFHGAAHWWQLTGSAGFKPGIRMRLAFWMDRKLGGRDVKLWLAKVKGLDGSIYTAHQLIYAATPIFEDGVEDPVPRRSGICDGDVVSPPEMRPALDSNSKPERWGSPQSALRSYREWRAAIGDHPDGQGFFEPIKSAIGAWVRAKPTEDRAWLRADLEKAIRAASRDKALHPDAYIEHRVRDLDSAIADIVKREQAKPPPAWVEEMNKSYAVVRFGDKAVVANTSEREIRFSRKEAFFDLHANKFPPSTDEDEGERKTKAQLWWKHRQRREYISPGVVLEPSAPPKERPGALNLWRGFAVEAKKGKWSLMQAHILNVLANGNGDHAKYILDWMAYCVQHPEVPAQTALAFTGRQGGGKGVVWRTFCALFAPHSLHFSDQNQFTGKFNANLGKAVFVFLDEAIWGGDKTIIGKVRAMITEPTLQIEPKGIDSMTVPNRLSLVSCSNEAWSVPIGIGDRRWGAFKTNDRYAYGNCSDAEREAYFGPLYAEIENGGLEAMLYELLRRQVTAGGIRNLPNTEEKARLKSRSLDTTPLWLETSLQRGELADYAWGEDGLVIDKDAPFDDYEQFCKARGKRSETWSEWWAALREIFGDRVNTNHRQTDDNGKRGPRKYKFPPLKRCRELFDAYVGNEIGGSHWTPAPAVDARNNPDLRLVPLEDDLTAKEPLRFKVERMGT